MGVTQAVVDWEPSCGNMLAGVGPAAIEMGLISQVDQVETKVRIRALNNGTFVEALVQTPNGQVGARLLLQSMAITCVCSYFLRFVLPLLLSVVELKVLGHMLYNLLDSSRCLWRSISGREKLKTRIYPLRELMESVLLAHV